MQVAEMITDQKVRETLLMATLGARRIVSARSMLSLTCWEVNVISPYSFVKESALGNAMLRRLSNPSVSQLERTTVQNAEPALREALERATLMERPAARSGMPRTQPNMFNTGDEMLEASLPWDQTITAGPQRKGFRIPTKILRNRGMNPSSPVKGRQISPYQELVDRIYARPSTFEPPKIGSALMHLAFGWEKLGNVWS